MVKKINITVFIGPNHYIGFIIRLLELEIRKQSKLKVIKINKKIKVIYQTKSLDWGKFMVIALRLIQMKKKPIKKHLTNSSITNQKVNSQH